MTGRSKTTEQRANEVLNKYEDWVSRDSTATAKDSRMMLRDLIYLAIQNAEAAVYMRMERNRKRPSPKAFPAFPFTNHRTMAEVMDTGDVA